MDICHAVLERHLMFKSGTFGTYHKVKFAIRDYVEQVRQKSDPLDIGETAWSEDHRDEGE